MNISIDVGGTGLRIKAADDLNQARLEDYILFQNTELEDGILVALSTLSQHLIQFPKSHAMVAISYPGPCIENMKPDYLPTLFGLDRAKAQEFCIRLEDVFRSYFGRVRIERLNDVTAAGYSIACCRPFHVLMLGSGLGWKMFRQNGPVSKESPFAGEICNMSMQHLGLILSSESTGFNREAGKEYNLNQYYRYLVKQRQYTVLGREIGMIAAFNVFTNGALDFFIGGGALREPRAAGQLEEGLRSKLEEVNPFKTIPLTPNITFLTCRHPALDGGLSYLYQMSSGMPQSPRTVI